MCMSMGFGKSEKEGWKYGETRNDELKTTSGLVPYEELPDSERGDNKQLYEP